MKRLIKPVDWMKASMKKFLTSIFPALFAVSEKVVSGKTFRNTTHCKMKKWTTFGGETIDSSVSNAQSGLMEIDIHKNSTPRSERETLGWFSDDDTNFVTYVENFSNVSDDSSLSAQER